MKIALAHLLVFFYIYSVSFTFIPVNVSTTLMFGVVGFILFIAKFLLTNSTLMHKRYLIFLFFVLLSSLMVFISVTVNQTQDLEMLILVIYMAVTFFSSYFVITTLKKIQYQVDFVSVSTLIINVIFIQSVIALSMFYMPWFGDLINQIQRLTDSESDIISNVNTFRITGFGTRFFEAGVISGFGLLLIGMQIRNNYYNNLLILSFKFLFIMIIGSMMARTTLIGALLGLLLIVLPKSSKPSLSLFKKRLLFLSSVIFLPVVLFSVLMNNKNFKEVMEPVFNFAFEAFINYFEQGTLESKSTNHLKEMYIFPSNLKTWLIGDGYWLNPVGSGYYMHTDVGYLRMIYFFGIPGLILFFLINYFSINLADDIESKKVISLIFITYLALLNLKGYIDITSFTLLLSMASIPCLKRRSVA